MDGDAWPKSNMSMRSLTRLAPSFKSNAVAPELARRGADPEREIFRNLLKQRWLLPPYQSEHAQRRRVFGLFLLVLVVYEGLSIPMQLAFYDSMPGDGPPGPQLAVGYLIDLCFWVEMALVFRTMHRGVEFDASALVTDPREIARRYYTSRAFKLDLFGLLPIEIFALGAPGGLASTAACALRLNRLLKISRVRTVHGFQLSKLSKIKMLLCKLGAQRPPCRAARGSLAGTQQPQLWQRHAHPSPWLPLPAAAPTWSCPTQVCSCWRRTGCRARGGCSATLASTRATTRGAAASRSQSRPPSRSPPETAPPLPPPPPPPRPRQRRGMRQAAS